MSHNPHKGVIDSLNLKDYSFEYMLDEDDFLIEDVKTIGVFDPQRWSETFSKPLTRCLIEAKIIHASNGSEIALKRYSREQKKQVIEFAGINGYTRKSKLLKEVLEDLRAKLENCHVSRIDIAIDMEQIPKSVINELLEKRKPFKYGHTTYYKTVSEKKTNQQIDIKHYNKSIKDNLPYSLERLEFCFKGQYFKKLELKDIETIFKKMEKGIKRFSGLLVKIHSL